MAKQRVREAVRKILEIEKKCPQCGVKFWGTKRMKYCAKKCCDLAYAEHNADRVRRYQAEYYKARKAGQGRKGAGATASGRRGNAAPGTSA